MEPGSHSLQDLLASADLRDQILCKLNLQSVCRLAQASTQLRAAAGASWQSRALDMGILHLPHGFGWMSVVVESLEASHNRDDTAMLREFDYNVEHITPWTEMRDGMCGIFEAKFAEYFFFEAEGPYPVHVHWRYAKGNARSAFTMRFDTGDSSSMGYRDSPVHRYRFRCLMSVDRSENEYKTIKHRDSIIVPDWPGMRPTYQTGIIQECTRSELAAVGFDRGLLSRYSHVAAVHYTVSEMFVLWDDRSPEGPLLRTSSLSVRDTGKKGRKDRIQLHYGSKLILSLNSDQHFKVDPYALQQADPEDNGVRITLQKLVDSNPRSTADVRSELPPIEAVPWPTSSWYPADPKDGHWEEGGAWDLVDQLSANPWSEVSWRCSPPSEYHTHLRVVILLLTRRITTTTEDDVYHYTWRMIRRIHHGSAFDITS